LHPEGKNLQTEIESKLQEFDASLSAFNDQSIISKINRNEDVVVDDFFMQMYVEAVRVSQHTHGAFDITVAPLVNAWGFGFGEKERKETPDVAAILPYVGSQKISLQNQRIVKTDSRIMLDASAIAKGQAADVIGELLEAEGCKNFMVEIGGEISCRGLNPKGKKWQIGIDRPDEILLEEQRPLQTILSLTDCGMATSGNYRQYYYRDGKKYAHTINPITGYPVDHNLLSATVISSSSMRADAYATAFMVLGVDSSLAICNRLPDVACYLIAEGKDNNYEVYYSDGFSDYFSNP
jgi:thiamine biosynthesis lipoprotein